MSRLLLLVVAVLCLVSVQAVSETAATAAQRNRLVGMVRVKSNAPAVDVASVEAKLQQFADLQKIDQTATKVRTMLAKINAFRSKVNAVHSNVRAFTAQLDNTLQRINDVAAQHEREQVIALQQFELNYGRRSSAAVQPASQPIVVQQAPQPAVAQQPPQPVVVQQAPQPAVVQQAPQPVVVQEALQPVIVQQQAPAFVHEQYVQYASPARRFVYRSPSVHMHLAGISTEFDALVAQHQLAHESAALDVQGSIHNLRSVLSQPLYDY